ncbi:hypothetical protein D3C87_900410 [compost metagenome]
MEDQNQRKYAIRALTKNVPHKDIEADIAFPWDKDQYLRRKDARKDIAVRLGCISISTRFEIECNYILPYEREYIMLNPNFTFDEKVKLLPYEYKYKFVCKYGTLDQLLKNFKGTINMIYLCKRKDLTLEFWEKFFCNRIDKYEINSFIYKNLSHHIGLGKDSLFQKFCSYGVLCYHKNVKLEDIHNLEVIVTNSQCMDALAKNLSFEDIMKIGIDKFDQYSLTNNPCINQLIQYMNISKMKKFVRAIHTNLMSFETIKQYELHVTEYNEIIQIQDFDKKLNTINRISSRNINELREFSHLLQKNEYIAYNKNVTLRDYELCTNKFYGILRRNVVPMKINTNSYNDIDIIIQ